MTCAPNTFLTCRSTLPLRPPKVDTVQVEEWLESEVKQLLAAQSVELGAASTGGSLVWDEGLEHVLMTALEAYEQVCG